MALDIGRFFDITCTQGGADAFVESSVDTDIVPEDGLILQVTGIEFYIVTDLKGISADHAINWQVSRDTKTAIASTADPDIILIDGREESLTTSGATNRPKGYRYAPSPGLYIVEPTIYAALDSDGTSATITALFRIFYKEVKASEVEILRIVNNT